MKRNMGIADRLGRGVLAVVVAVLYFTHQLSPVAGVVLGILAVVFLVTAVAGCAGKQHRTADQYFGEASESFRS